MAFNLLIIEHSCMSLILFDSILFLHFNSKMWDVILVNAAHFVINKNLEYRLGENEVYDDDDDGEEGSV